MNLGTLNIILTASNTGLLAGLKTAGKAFDDFGKKIASGNMNLKTFALGTGLLGTGILTLTGVLAGTAIKAAADWQQQLITIGNNAGMTSSQIADMGNTVMQMSAQMGASKTDLMTAYMYIHDMGYAGKDATDILTAATKEALATGSSIADTSSVLATAMHSFKIPIKDAATTIDMLHTAAASARMTMQDFMQSFGPVGAQASAIGIPLNDAAAAMAALTRNGFDASMSATQVRDMLLHIMAPSKAAKAEIDALSGGIGSNAIASGKMSLKNLEAAQKIQNLTAKIQIANQRLTELQTGHKSTAISTQADTMRISEYETRIEEANAKIAAETAHIANLESAHKKNANTIANAQNRLASYQDTIANYNDKIVLTRARLSALSDTTTTNITTVEGAKLRITELNQQLQDAGIKAGLTKTQIQGVSKAGIDLAFDFSQAGLHAKGLSGVLADLKIVTGGNAEEMNKLIPNLRGGLGALVLVNNGHKDLIDILNKEKSSLGSTEAAYALYSTTTVAQMNRAREGFNNVQIAIGTALLPTVNRLLQAILPIIQAFAVWADQHPQLVDGIIIAAAALGGLLLAISAITGAIAILTPAVAVAGVAIGAISLPVLGVIAGSIALGAAIGLLAAIVVDNWTKIKNFIGQAVAEIKIHLREIILFFGPVGILASGVIDFVGTLISNLTRGENAFQALKDTINKVANDIKNTLSALAKDAGNLLSHLNPLAHHSPSLVEQVASGIAQIKSLYQSISGMNISSPNIGTPNMGGLSGSIGGGIGGTNPYALAPANNFSYQNINTPTSSSTINNTFNIKGQENAVGFAEYLGFQMEHLGIV